MPKYFFYISILLLLLPGTAAAGPFEYDLHGGLYQGIFAGENFWDPYTRRFDRDEAFAVTRVSTGLSVDFGSRYSGYLAGAVDWIHDFEPENKDDVDPFLLNAVIRYSGDRISVDAGKQPFSLGRGLVFDDDEEGIWAQWTANETFSMEFEAAQAFDSSPLLSVSATYRPGFLEEIKFLGMWMHDEDNGFADLLNRQVGWDLFSGDGDLYWVGAAADLFFGDIFFSGIGMVQSGKMHVTSADGNKEFNLSAWLFDLEASVHLTDVVSAGAFLFGASGDRHPGSRHLHSFVSARPYNSRADIFFNGAVDGHDEFEGFSLAGIRWPGVIAPGMLLSARPHTNWLAEVSAAALFPQADGSSLYGWETDLSITRTWADNNAVYLMIGFFSPGGMLEHPDGERPDPVVSGMVGVNLWF